MDNEDMWGYIDLGDMTGHLGIGDIKGQLDMGDMYTITKTSWNRNKIITYINLDYYNVSYLSRK
jgi:hypothetical protein